MVMAFPTGCGQREQVLLAHRLVQSRTGLIFVGMVDQLGQGLTIPTVHRAIRLHHLFKNILII
jgi:hypothetical protein